MPPHFQWPSATALKVREAAVCLCLRRVETPVPEVLTRRDAYRGGQEWAQEKVSGSFDSRANLLLKSDSDDRQFHGEWEVLMGQNECVNWLRSTKDHVVCRRYPGEWVFAGGAVDRGETPAQAALRELREEFLVEPPPDNGLPPAHILRLMSVRQTRPIGGRTDIMYNYVAMASENQWLAEIDIDEINQQLSERRAIHTALLQSGEFWGLTKKAKLEVSPEVRRLRWVGLREAVVMMFTSMNDELVCVDNWQREQFAAFHIERRDPMFLTMALLLDIESFPSERSLVRHTNSVNIKSALEKAQWLYEGMSQTELDMVMQSRQRQDRGEHLANGDARTTAEDLERLRSAREAEDEIEHLFRSQL